MIVRKLVPLIGVAPVCGNDENKKAGHQGGDQDLYFLKDISRFHNTRLTQVGHTIPAIVTELPFSVTNFSFFRYLKALWGQTDKSGCPEGHFLKLFLVCKFVEGWTI